MGGTHTGEAAAFSEFSAELRADLASAVHLTISFWCLLVTSSLLELPRQGGTLAKGMAVELRTSDVAFFDSETPQSSHLSTLLP